ncbi:MAG TPA: hypothetical protein VHD63_01365 [Ktedonobacteraceae bacterium]|nr:hypothetical protein [Ktedonobacteraceae bacterium]
MRHTQNNQLAPPPPLTRITIVRTNITRLSLHPWIIIMRTNST